jgi:5-methylcytosine-specific restriction endonuclease McrA
MYIDEETGLTLYELHKNQPGVDIPLIRKSNVNRQKKLLEILNGERETSMKPEAFQQLLIEEGIFEESCSLCGFDERRITDYTVPLKLAFKDGNTSNFKKDNLELLCYNCFYLTYENPLSKITNKDFR